MWNRSGQIDFFMTQTSPLFLPWQGDKKRFGKSEMQLWKRKEGEKHVGNVLIKDKKGFLGQGSRWYSTKKKKNIKQTSDQFDQAFSSIADTDSNIHTQSHPYLTAGSQLETQL